VHSTLTDATGPLEKTLRQRSDDTGCGCERASSQEGISDGGFDIYTSASRKELERRLKQRAPKTIAVKDTPSEGHKRNEIVPQF